MLTSSGDGRGGAHGAGRGDNHVGPQQSSVGELARQDAVVSPRGAVAFYDGCRLNEVLRSEIGG